jgi:hypothetical protein
MKTIHIVIPRDSDFSEFEDSTDLMNCAKVFEDKGQALDYWAREGNEIFCLNVEES